MSLRVLLVNAHGADPAVGGTEKHLRRLGRLLPERGFEAMVLSAFPQSETPPGEAVTLHATDWRTSRRRRLANHLGDAASHPGRALDAAVERLRPDLLHTHNLPGIGTGIWEVAARRGLPVVHTLHDYHLLCPRVTLLRPDGAPCRPHPFLCGVRARRMARWSGAVTEVIAVSEHLLRRHEGIFHHARERVVPNPFEPTAGLSVGAPGARFATLGYLGSLERTKGVDRLIEATPELGHLGVRVLVAGDGRLRAQVENAASHIPSLEYRGVVGGTAKAAFITDCDAGIMPSVWEEPGGPPNSMLEWLSFGRPVLASPRGGLKEAVARLSGTMALEPTAAGILSGVRRLLDEASWRRLRGAVRPVAGDSDEERWLAAHEDAYRRALAERMRAR